MSRNRKDFKTYYRYDGNGRIIPGSNILKKGYAPEEGKWKQADAYECCLPDNTISYWVVSRDLLSEVDWARSSEFYYSDVDSEGNTYRIENTSASTLNTDDNVFYLTKLDPTGVSVWETTFSLARSTSFNNNTATVVVASTFVYMHVYYVDVNQYRLLKISQADGTIIEQTNTYSIPSTSGNSFLSNAFVDSNDNFTAFYETNDLSDNFRPYVIRHNSDDIENNREAFIVSSTDAEDSGYYGWYNNGQLLGDDILVGYNTDFTGFTNYGNITGIASFNASGAPAVTSTNGLFLVSDAEPLLSGSGDTEMRSVAQDSSGNYYLTAYNETIIKLDSTASNWLWANNILGYNIPELFSEPLQGVVDSSDNLYVIWVTYKGNISPPESISITKLQSATGNIEWAYNVYWNSPLSNTTDMRPDLTFSPVVRIENDIIYLTSDASFSFKLPVNNPIIPGVYETYTIEDVTAEFTGVSTLLDVAANPFSAPAANMSLNAVGTANPIVQPPLITLSPSARTLVKVDLPEQTP